MNNHIVTRASDASIVTRIASVTATATPNVFQAVLSTNADVRRGSHIERLGRWNTLPARVPLLDSHRRESVENVIGFVDNIRTENGSIIGDVHVSETRPTVATLLRERAIDSLSIGFAAESWSDRTEGGERIRTGEGLTLREASVVVLGADHGARLRADDDAGRIRDLAATLRVPDATAELLVTRNVSFDDARRELIAEAARTQPRIEGRSAAMVTREASPADHAAALGQALAHRLGAGNVVGELGRQFTNDRFPQVAKRLLDVSGISTMGLSEAALVKRVLTTSDYPILMGEFLNVSLQAAYRSAPSPLMALVKNMVVADFNSVHLPRLSQSPLLEEILESGEVTFGALAESEEVFRVSRWGKGLLVSFQLLVSDRLGSISETIRSWGYSVAETEAREIDRYLTMNNGLGPTMADTKPLFDAAHNNLLTPGAAPSETTFDQARVAMRRMVDRFGQRLGLSPLYVVCPPELETACRKLVATVNATATDEVNPFSGWQVLVDSRLTDDGRYYFFADPNAAPVFVRATLAGFEGPRVESQVDFLTDNTAVKCTHNFGFGVADWVGGSTNAGV